MQKESEDSIQFKSTFPQPTGPVPLILDDHEDLQERNARLQSWAWIIVAAAALVAIIAKLRLR